MPRLKAIPEWGAQSFVQGFKLRKAGSSSNVAFALAKLGINSSLVASVGSDIYGREIIEDIKMNGLSVEGIDIIESASTGICVCFIREDGQRLIISSLGSMNTFDESAVNRHRHLIEQADYLFLSGYFVAPGIGFEGSRNILRGSKENGKCTLLDTGWAPDGWSKKTKEEVVSLLKYVDVFLPNFDEARMLTDIAEPKEMAQKLLACGCGEVIIKLGADGSLAANEDGIFQEDAFSVEVVDTTAAGDAFDAAIIYGLIKGWETGRKLQFANAVAAIIVSRLENRYSTVNEVESLIRKQHQEGVKYNDIKKIQSSY